MAKATAKRDSTRRVDTIRQDTGMPFDNDLEQLMSLEPLMSILAGPTLFGFLIMNSREKLQSESVVGQLIQTHASHLCGMALTEWPRLTTEEDRI